MTDFVTIAIVVGLFAIGTFVSCIDLFVLRESNPRQTTKLKREQSIEFGEQLCRESHYFSESEDARQVMLIYGEALQGIDTNSGFSDLNVIELRKRWRKNTGRD